MLTLSLLFSNFSSSSSFTSFHFSLLSHSIPLLLLIFRDFEERRWKGNRGRTSKHQMFFLVWSVSKSEEMSCGVSIWWGYVKRKTNKNYKLNTYLFISQWKNKWLFYYYVFLTCWMKFCVWHGTYQPLPFFWVGFASASRSHCIELLCI